MRRRRQVLGMCTGLLFCLLGCSSHSAKMYPVSGEVTVDGKPMEAGSVALHPDGSQANHSADISAGVVRDGKYEIYTGQKRGAPPGSYKVLVTSTNFSGDNPPPMGGTAQMPKSLIDPTFGHLGTTPLTVEIVSDPQDGAYSFSVTK